MEKEDMKLRKMPIKEIEERYYGPEKHEILYSLISDAASTDQNCRYVFRGPSRISAEKKAVREVHIFAVEKGDVVVSSCCTRYPAQSSSLPQPVDNDEEILSSEQARFLAARLGRHVCGECASRLFGETDSR